MSESKRSGVDPTQDTDQEQRSILINFVLDASGSMESIRDATISGFNEFLGDQKREGGEARITLTLFNTGCETITRAVPVREVPDLTFDTYVPGGMTALFDAIGQTMHHTDHYYAEQHPDQVLFVIMTDGLENASRQYTREQIFQMIADRQLLAGYEFIYLGANQDAYAAGQAMGIRGGKTLNYSASPQEAAQTWQRASHNVRAYRRHGARQMEDDAFFSAQFEAMGAKEYDEHRRDRGGKKPKR